LQPKGAACPRLSDQALRAELAKVAIADILSQLAANDAGGASKFNPMLRRSSGVLSQRTV
jgi:hypothetical protein